jgi:hypothetical protein
MAYDLPGELDVSKLRYIGRGFEALDMHLAKSGARTVALAPDVAKAFRTEAEINEALRLVQKMREIGRSSKGKKSA